MKTSKLGLLFIAFIWSLWIRLYDRRVIEVTMTKTSYGYILRALSVHRYTLYVHRIISKKQ